MNNYQELLKKALQVTLEQVLIELDEEQLEEYITDVSTIELTEGDEDDYTEED